MNSGQVSVIKDHYAEVVPAMMAVAVGLQDKGEVMFVDCANRFDPYFINKASGGRGRQYLKHIFVSRPFTIYQLKELVVEKLEEFVKNNGCRVLLINCINYFDGDGVGKEEAKAIKEMVHEKVAQITRDYGLTTVISIAWRGDDGSIRKR
ncbi:MAG: hypothetical protein ABH851_09330 [Methanobacteriota archaeon]